MGMLDATYYGHTITQWATAAAIIVGAAIAGKLIYWVFGNIIKKLTAKSKTRLDDILVDMAEEPVAFAIVLGGIWYSLTQYLQLVGGVRDVVGFALQFCIILNVGWALARLFDALFEEYLVPLAENSETDLDDQLLPILRKGTKLVVWTVSVMIAFDNAGYDVGAALAGLGIGGIALAMAGRDTIANMFGGFTVFLDQPFKLNDRVQVSGYDGTIQEIGLRSTRLRTLEGRVVTIPNAQFTDTPVENVSLEPGRKVVNNIGLTYDMTAEQMEEAMKILLEIGEANESVSPDPAIGFTEFGDSSMGILFIYWIEKDADILATKTAVNLSILRRFGERGLDMAFPTQTVYTKAG